MKPIAPTKNKSTRNYVIMYYDIFQACNIYERSVLLEIATFQNSKKGCFMKQPELADKAKLSVAQLKRALKSLKDKQLITVIRHSNNLQIFINDRSNRPI